VFYCLSKQIACELSQKPKNENQTGKADALGKNVNFHFISALGRKKAFYISVETKSENQKFLSF
jgi:hypothetical protein